MDWSFRTKAQLLRMPAVTKERWIVLPAKLTGTQMTVRPVFINPMRVASGPGVGGYASHFPAALSTYVQTVGFEAIYVGECLGAQHASAHYHRYRELFETLVMSREGTVAFMNWFSDSSRWLCS